jgi:hypothetical protein
MSFAVITQTVWTGPTRPGVLFGGTDAQQVST